MVLVGYFIFNDTRMPALDALGGDPCSLLNKAEYPTLWLTITTPIGDNIATGGTPIAFSNAINGDLSKNVLATLSPSSPFTLIQFLSGGTVAKQTTLPYTTLGNIILQSGTTKKTIVDSYFVTTATGAYTYSTNLNKKLSPANLWSPSDATNGVISTTPSSVLGKLINDGFLISQVQLFRPSDFDPSTPPAPGGESLVYLYKIAQGGTLNLTSTQINRKATLEAKNLRFFAAWLVEYCFYRTRYEVLLSKYFSVYSQQSSDGTTPYTPPDETIKSAIFNGSGAAENQYSGSSVSQPDYLKGLAYQMACLNTRMTDMRLLLGKISEYYNAVYLEIQNTINDDSIIGSNTDLTNKINALNDSALKAQKYLSERDFHQGVMEYNAEKNRYSNILLGLYAFLNISAIAIVINILQ
jgi:hypothetical protein